MSAKCKFFIFINPVNNYFNKVYELKVPEGSAIVDWYSLCWLEHCLSVPGINLRYTPSGAKALKQKSGSSSYNEQAHGNPTPS